jgi:hypothetical protein
MPFKRRRITKFIVLPLATVAVAASAAVTAQPVGAHIDRGRLCTTVGLRGYPNAVPPILPPPPCSALAAIKGEEAFEGQEFWSDPPAAARYSSVEMKAYANESK